MYTAPILCQLFIHTVSCDLIVILGHPILQKGVQLGQFLPKYTILDYFHHSCDYLFVHSLMDVAPPTHTLLILVTAGTMPLAYLYVWFHKVLPVPTKNNIIYSRWLIYIC